MIEPSADAELVRAFTNTVDLDDETDEFATTAAAGEWLLALKLLDRPAQPTAADLRSLVDLRTGIREALAVDGPASPHLLAVGEAVLRSLPLLASLSPQAPLQPSPGLVGVPRALATVGVAWSRLVVTGQSARLKRCPAETCGWVFWDVSRNNSRRWCTMRVCGNRAKARAFAARQRG